MIIAQWSTDTEMNKDAAFALKKFRVKKEN